MAKAIDDTPSIKNVVLSTVYDALILLCGYELNGGGDTHQVSPESANIRNSNGSDNNHKEDHENHKVMNIQQWRQELYQMVENSVTFRMSGDGGGDHNHANDTPPLERTKLYDIEIRTAMAYYQRYRDKASSLLSITSDLGVTRTIHSPFQFAHDYLLPIIEYELQLNDISNHVRVAKSSCFICCISHTLMKQILSRQQQEQEQHPGEVDYNHNYHHRSKKMSSLVLHWESCPYCPLWCHGGNKGLWWHLQQQHSMLHHTATETSTTQCSRNSTAIIVYDENMNRSLLSNLSNVCGVRTDDSSMDRRTGTGRAIVATSSTVSQQLVPQEPSASTAKATTFASSQPKVYSDPWECIQTSGTLAQFVQCLDRQPPSFDCCQARDKYGAVLLHWAAGNGTTDIVQYLIEQKDCPVNIQQVGKKCSYTGRTPLHWAARNGHYHTVHYILQYANRPDFEATLLHECLEAQTIDGTTPFCWAAWQGHLNIMQLFYQYGCQVNTMNRYRCNAVLWVAQHPSSGDNHADSSTATSSRIVKVLQWLVNVGCDFLVLNNSGHGVLHKGAQRGCRDICAWYLNQLTTMIEKEQQQQQQDEEKDDEDDALTCEFITSLLNVFGPNNDGCVPSDLAGMENHIELAIYLSEQEQQFIGLLTGKLKSSSSSLPKWLSPLPKGVTNRFNRHQHNIWEPGAGVFRMRSVLNTFQ